ncbi:cohesin domain-containing protein [Aporhodopirellula aestuarii]|uniref:Carboxypeptidase regulatory-like domain-containing protein n=1 Tax=Aporhodopirellula aestuarii TaxID=2950107 RepID=A0ABT0U0E3_9BACT|nr:SdrD B-like domain-containing protein [Aporhodopirellula aestuarii]MCM2369953.1 carboxypeptidase regulatory-like domain-containing protein [Aporhodopirellula aestuarii]
MKSSLSRRLSFQTYEDRRLLAAVDIPDDLSAAPAAIVSAPVNIDTASGVRAAEIRLSYDTSVLDLDPDAITLGSVWGTGTDAQITANVDDANGTVVIFIASSSELSGISGSLVLLPFSIASNAVVDSTTTLDLTLVSLNEGQISATPTPVAGSDATDGLITIAGDATGSDTISGFVYADANNDSNVDTAEGIPGVTITLVNATTGAERQTTTASDGSFEFTQVAAGSYRIIQTQPVAYIDGGTNELTVSLSEGGSLEDQNFRELGLLPQFLYNRLHTALVMPVGSTSWNDSISQINADAEASTTATTVAIASNTTDTTSSTETAASEPLPSERIASSQRVAASEPLAELESADDVTPSSNVTASQAAPNKDENDDTAAVDEVFANSLF